MKITKMKREIKFRAWDKQNKKMLILCRLGLRGFSHQSWSPSPISNEHHFDCTLEIMQFTGLLDKNGKEIYEGDIVLYEDRRWEVVFEYDRWDMKRGENYIRYDDLADDPGYTTWEYCEIIGNIYENPDLL